MYILKQMIADIFIKIGNAFLKLAKKLNTVSVVVTIEDEKPRVEEEPNLFEEARAAYKREEAAENRFLTEHPIFGNMSFMEALNSDSFSTRHEMANDIVSWYLGFEKGEVKENVLYRCAEVLLETVGHVIADEHKLVAIWNRLHISTDKVESEEAHKEETEFFDNLEREMTLKSLPGGRLDK